MAKSIRSQSRGHSACNWQHPRAKSCPTAPPRCSWSDPSQILVRTCTAWSTLHEPSKVSKVSIAINKTDEHPRHNAHNSSAVSGASNGTSKAHSQSNSFNNTTIETEKFPISPTSEVISCNIKLARCHHHAISAVHILRDSDRKVHQKNDSKSDECTSSEQNGADLSQRNVSVAISPRQYLYIMPVEVCAANWQRVSSALNQEQSSISVIVVRFPESIRWLAGKLSRDADLANHSQNNNRMGENQRDETSVRNLTDPCHISVTRQVDSR